MHPFSLLRSLRSAASVFLLATPLVSAYTQLSDSSLKAIPLFSKDLDVKTGEILAPILRVRIPGTPEIEEVRQHFLRFFAQHLPSWRIELQNSTQDTALNRPITFVNIIATRDPPWAKEGDVGRLSLVAHYDSKLTPEGFIGATDSAAPCAAILATARSIDAALTRKWDDMQAKGHMNDLGDDERGVQILLLDGEEAFINWSHDDSLYGARSLAQDWDIEKNSALSTYHNRISQISLFLLLDLLGSAEPNLPSYFQTTHWAFKNMGNVERRLRAAGLFKSRSSAPWFGDFEMTKDERESQGAANVRWAGGLVEDDHIPFMARGVEILHLIPSPFPRVWHTQYDDGDHLDQATVDDWATLTAAFTAEWLELDGYMGARPAIGGAQAARGVDSESPHHDKREEGQIGKSELFAGK